MLAMPVADERGYHLEGLMCPFDASHSNADLQFVYVNGRFVRAKPLTHILQRFFAISNRVLSIDQSHAYGSREFKQRYVYYILSLICAHNVIDAPSPVHVCL
jgi:DNA mismatch repair ATPase MutL